MLRRAAVARPAWLLASSLVSRSAGSVPWAAAAGLLGVSDLPCQPWAAQCRHASTTSQTPSFAATQALLEAAQAHQFQARLEELRQQHSCLPFSELVVECRKSLAPGTEDDAERVCQALHSAGVIMRSGALALLRPADIMEVATQILPLDTAQLQQRLEQAQSQLAPLEQRHEQLRRRVAWQRSAFKWGGLALLSAHFGIFFRLTFWELSWDVMEPVAFLVSSFSGIVMYAWFMRTSSEFSWSDAEQRMVSRWEERAFRKAKFDSQQYAKLRREVQRYAEMLHAQQQLQQEREQQQLEDGGGPEEEILLDKKQAS